MENLGQSQIVGSFGLVILTYGASGWLTLRQERCLPVTWLLKMPTLTCKEMRRDYS